MSTINQEQRHFFDYNMGFSDIIIRYAIMMIFGVIGGLTHQLWLMLMVVPIFIFAVTGWSPIHAILGRNTSEQKHQDQENF